MKIETKPISREEKIAEIARVNTLTERLYEANFRASGMTDRDEFNKTLRPGAGKGKEPRPWCGCHFRNPCPIDLEYERLVRRGV